MKALRPAIRVPFDPPGAAIPIWANQAAVRIVQKGWLGPVIALRKGAKHLVFRLGMCLNGR
jgi:hypothetical protein